VAALVVELDAAASGTVADAGTTCNAPPSPSAAASAVLFAAIAICSPERRSHPSTGVTAIHEAGPTVHHRRPIEMLRNSRTIAGSN
jgi:hypothetical protein